MKDERTLADHSGDANEMVLCPTCGALPCDQTQALRSQPSVEEVARVIWIAFTGNPNIFSKVTKRNETAEGCYKAARQIASMYEEKGG